MNSGDTIERLLSKRNDPVSSKWRLLTPQPESVLDVSIAIQQLAILTGFRQAGFQLIFDLSPNHRGVTGAVKGAIVVDGGLYSPGMPEDLRNLQPPAVGSSIDQINRYQELIAERQRYALRRLGARPQPDGTVRFQCPAAAKRIRCPLKPASLTITTSKGLIVPTMVPDQNAQGEICQQSTITIDLNHADATTRTMGYIGALYQKHPYGSDAWYDSFNRRSLVESAFANIKNDAEQNLRRPSIRMMGNTKVTLWTLWITIAANLRMARLWRHRRLLREQKSGLHNGPVVSDTMKAAAEAKQRAHRRRRRQQEAKHQRPRGRPPG